VGHRLGARGQGSMYQEGGEAFRVTDRRFDSDKAALMGESLARVSYWAPSHA